MAYLDDIAADWECDAGVVTLTHTAIATGATTSNVKGQIAADSPQYRAMQTGVLSAEPIEATWIVWKATLVTLPAQGDILTEAGGTSWTVNEIGTVRAEGQIIKWICKCSRRG